MLDLKTTNGHSLISPSGAGRWAMCAGSVRLTMHDADTTNPMAQRGTDIHQLGENLLKGATFTEGTSVIRDGDGTGMFYANRDMLEEAEAYKDYVHALMEKDSELHVESKVMIFPEFDLSGHVDACVIADNVLHVIDLKTGRGAVSAENNLQMQLYALGLYDEHEMFHDIDLIKLHIVQDNAMIHNTNSWELSVDDLMDFKDWIYDRAELALQEDSTCTPSPSACQWCTHAPRCSALLETSQSIIKGDFEDMDELAQFPKGDLDKVVTMEQVLEMLNHKALINTLLKAYEQRVFDALNSGEEVEGFKLVMGRKNKAWVNETEAYDKLKTWLPLDDVAPRKLCTPTQAVKLMGKDISTRKRNTFEELYTVPEGQPQVAPASDKRPAIVPTDDFEEL